MENARLHISNSVLDNCLSTLKHETMYYPSRIRQLINGTDDHLNYMAELATYYKELYTILSQQAMRQVDAIKQKVEVVELYGARVMGDRDMLTYLFDILKKQSGENQLSVQVTKKNAQYLVFDVAMPQVNLRESECLELFMPTMQHIPYLLCRQIVRDNGESTNYRGCGIIAQPASVGIHILVTLAKAGERKVAG